MISSLEDLNRLCDTVVMLGLPTEQNVFIDTQQKEIVDKFLFGLPSSGVLSFKLNNADLPVNKIFFRGISFTFILF